MNHDTQMTATTAPPTIEGIIYGPVPSRRLGVSLGINILPADRKVCTFNCIYCQFGWTRAYSADGIRWPRALDVARALESALRDQSCTHGLNRLTLAGHGEPTLHPQFADVLAKVTDVRNHLAPTIPMAVLTNGTRLSSPSVAEALRTADECYVKLDAGSQDTLRRVNASSHSLPDLVAGLKRLPNAIIQSLFVHDPLGRCGNDGPEARASWLETVSRVHPRAVHLYTLARRPALFRLEPVAPSALRELADRLRARGIRADTFY